MHAAQAKNGRLASLAGSILSVESNQNVESKTKMHSVQNSIFTLRHQIIILSPNSFIQVVKYVMTQCQRTLCIVAARN